MTPSTGSATSSVAHYPLKHRITAWISSTLFDKFQYTVRHGLLAGMKRRGGLGWLPAAISSSVETPEIEFWRRLQLSGAIVYEAGAFQGLITLHLAKQAAQVFAYEPNPKSRARLIENLRLNGIQNVRVLDVGLGSERGALRMFTSELMPGGSSVDPELAETIERSGAEVSVMEIPIITLDGEWKTGALPTPDFIKLDVEGWELEALKGAREMLASCHPALFIEMHGETMQSKRAKAAAIFEFLIDAGYSEIRHVETGRKIDRFNTELAAEGHLYCQGATARVKSTFQWSGNERGDS